MRALYNSKPLKKLSAAERSQEVTKLLASALEEELAGRSGGEYIAGTLERATRRPEPRLGAVTSCVI